MICISDKVEWIAYSLVINEEKKEKNNGLSFEIILHVPLGFFEEWTGYNMRDALLRNGYLVAEFIAAYWQ